MLILALNGSPRPDGNTAELLRIALAEAVGQGAEGQLIQVCRIMSRQKVPYCVACSHPCTGNCYAGTELEEVLSLLRRADGIIMGSPVYFSTVAAPLKAFWDKTRRLRYERALVNVVGGAVAVGGARFGGQETTLSALHDMMLCQGMTVVGDGLGEVDAGHQGACAQGPVAADKDGALRVRVLARRVVEVARATRELRHWRSHV